MKRWHAIKWLLYVLAIGIIALISFVAGRNSAGVPAYAGSIPKALVNLSHGAAYRDVESIIDVNDAISDLCREWGQSNGEVWAEAYVIPTGFNSYTVLYWPGAVGKEFPSDLEAEIDRLVDEHAFKWASRNQTRTR
jgi:hypothetical protein